MDDIVKKQQEIEYALGVVDSMDVSLDSNIEILQDISSEATRVYKELENERQKATKPINESLRHINGWFKPILGACDTLKRRANSRLVEANKAREEARERALGEIAQSGVHVTSTAVIPAQAKPVELPKGVGRAVIEVRIDDPSKVPAEFLVPDVAAIKRAATKAHKEGVKLEVPGVCIIVKESGT